MHCDKPHFEEIFETKLSKGFIKNFFLRPHCPEQPCLSRKFLRPHRPEYLCLMILPKLLYIKLLNSTIIY